MASDELEVDRLRVKLPRSYKALVQLYPVAWNQMLAVVEEAMARGQTASVIAGRLSILRGLDRCTRRWVVLSIQADRREIVNRGQMSFLTQLHDKSLDEILAELKELEASSAAGSVPGPPHDDRPRGFVFISHHTTTAGKLARGLAEGIEASGASCWIAPRDIPAGVEWNEEVYSAAQRCGALVLLYSEEARRSKAVQGEVHIVVARGVPVITVKLGEGDPARVHVGLAAYQQINWIGRAPGDLAELVGRVHADLRALGIGTQTRQLA